MQEDDYVIYDDKNMRESKRNIKRNKEIIQIIMKMTSKEAKQIHISERQLIRLRKKIKNNENLVLRRKTVRKIIGLKGSVKFL